MSTSNNCLDLINNCKPLPVEVEVTPLLKLACIGQEESMADECTNGKDDLGNKSYPCISCGKTFPSGNALGGHEGQKPSKCGKEFGSVKALNGHMNAHRERPPTGRKGMNKQKTENFDDVPSGSCSSLLVDVSEPKLASCDDSAKDKNVVNSSPRHEPANQTNISILELNQQKRDISSGKMIIPEQHGATFNGDGDVTKISTPNNLANYTCPLCDKNFDSPQALGGHMAGHTRKNRLHLCGF